MDNTQNIDLIFGIFAVLIFLGGLFMVFRGSSGIER